ncbi:chromosome segregation protein SMC [Thioalkalivibrio sp. XN8]|uniref:chromosome segregation protein SMC n=1 Tax=Thioalkalivibrio sp. XN8 TaxID=2712863 RepID=UPI0013EACB43|nr:chromosome segregation protein SMC [Thioalkalivibrio sp. XN8]NGP54585.1 chromosome segregation protein SMC [Thioalkalivibrio sp. XN8]
MRLSKIKLAGFKSFVDPTTIHFPSNLVGVVGPNGCGKSNVIDAVRWVMGESSAKHLRGDAMTDVIFNGSTGRKPVGTASIELLFDNSDGAAGGQYAGFGEISARRVLSRDGTSTYFLNGARCRRKDITNLFLGTGLGPRSYAIIEQGMISRLIEAKPEELRTYLEEAAGISKYKERRRETETRIRHTRENLERLNDLREEVEKQIRHLQRQARTAERYREMKAGERRLEAELLALRLGGLEAEASRHRALLAEGENRLQEAVAALRRVEAELEAARERHREDSEALNVVQGDYYRVGAEIARAEQSIQHARDLRHRQGQELEQAEQGLLEIHQHINRDQDTLAELNRVLGELGPELESARSREAASAEALRSAEQAMQDWQAGWDEFNREAANAREVVEVERARIEQLDGQLARFADRRRRLQEEHGRLQGETGEVDLEAMDRELQQAREREQAAQQQDEAVRDEILALREEDATLVTQLDEGRNALQTLRGTLASLEALQQAALGRDGGKLIEWLDGQGLAGRPRLAEKLAVEPGWERAVETVLGDYLEAVCVEGLDEITGALDQLTQGAASFVEFNAGAGEAVGEDLLAHKVQGGAGARSLLRGVRAVEDLGAALALRSDLRPGESVITRDGIWLGANWLRVNRAEDPHAGVLAREQEIRELRASLGGTAYEVEELVARHEEVQARLAMLESSREEVRQRAAEAHRSAAGLQAGLDTARSRMEQAGNRLQALAQELGEIETQQAEMEESVRQSRARLQQGIDSMSDFEARRLALEEERAQLRATLESARDQSRADRAAAQEIAIRVESRRSSLDSASVSMQRFQEQVARFSARKQELERQLDAGVEPLAEQEARLASMLADRVQSEERLAAARRKVQEVEATLREQQDNRSVRDTTVAEARESVEAARLAANENRVRLQTAVEQFTATGFELETLRAELPEDAAIPDWEERLAQLATKIERLGPINLASIDELQEQTERKSYLDAQLADLNDALTTLENAIRRIDRETRARFKDTFDEVNAGIQEIFPRLFGGGHAYLQLESDDLLEAGVTVMARPPGKRISTIHLMSGGEKALTAVALVFAIFQLNPAPFCMLDEVDAPLDDANVGRFCDIVRSMSEKVQFIIITHNKTTMEMVSQLTGVTMHEPGVSRLVAVDIEEAVRMATA